MHTQAESVGMLARVRTLSSPVREREREAEFSCLQGCAHLLQQSEIEIKRKRDIKRDKEKERHKERERET
jgi:hypothetical protein